MSLSIEVPALREALRSLHAAGHELELTVRVDRPAGDGLAVADRIADDTVAMVSDVDAALAALTSSAHTAVLHQVGACVLGVRRRLDESFWSHTAASALVRAVRPHGPEWQAWARGVLSGAGRCVARLFQVDSVLLRCWLEVAELADAHSAVRQEPIRPWTT